MKPAFIDLLIREAASTYRTAGRFAYYVARGKFTGDPIFTALLELGLIPDNAVIVDLGCGKGLLGAWLQAAEALTRSGKWPQNWTLAPKLKSYVGIEVMQDQVNLARQVERTGKARIIQGDIRIIDYDSADVVVIFDVLHYLNYAEQVRVLTRVRETLSPSGLLLVRIGDANKRMPFLISKWVDHIVILFSGRGLSRFYCRSLHQWMTLLNHIGFEAENIPMSQGTPFGNSLIIGRLNLTPTL